MMPWTCCWTYVRQVIDRIQCSVQQPRCEIQAVSMPAVWVCHSNHHCTCTATHHCRNSGLLRMCSSKKKKPVCLDSKTYSRRPVYVKDLATKEWATLRSKNGRVQILIKITIPNAMFWCSWCCREAWKSPGTGPGLGHCRSCGCSDGASRMETRWNQSGTSRPAPLPPVGRAEFMFWNTAGKRTGGGETAW